MDQKIKLPDKTLKIMRVFSDKKAEIYVVGGAVRDLVMGREIKDWDLTSSLTPKDILKLFPKNSFYNNQFGTVGIIWTGEVFEVTTFRTEANYQDGRHPNKVDWGKSLQEDCQRRDFTINAMAINETGQLFDYYGGQKDLKNRLIRCVGKADERFKEDALRLLRAVRIAGELGFTIDKTTFKAIVGNAKSIQNISGERIRQEIFRLLLCSRPADGVKLLKNTGLLQYILPEILPGQKLSQKGHHIYDVWTHSLETLNNCQSQNPVTRLAALVHDIGKPAVVKGEGETRTFYKHEIVGSRMAAIISKRLKLSKKESDLLFRLVRWHMFTASELQSDKAVRRLIRNVTPEYLAEMIALRRADRVGSGARETSWRWELLKKRLIEVQKQPFSVKDLKIDGHDVMEILKIKPGRRVGEVLAAIFTEVEQEPKLNDRDVLLEKLRKIR
jgi:tRNA nucleotidyltransferase/poly(A) polymerase